MALKSQTKASEPNNSEPMYIDKAKDVQYYNGACI